jgi:16S rRNA (cytosine967-C5)-methyltransferase
MRRRVDLRWRVTLEELERLRKEQLDIMDRACRQIRKGGTLVYSTCSLEPEENSELIKEFLKEHPRFELKNERELLPFVDKVDGGYVARLRLKDDD